VSSNEQPYVQVHATQRATKTYERRETPAFKKSAEGYVPKQEEEGLLHLLFDKPDPVSLTIEVCILKGLSGIETVRCVLARVCFGETTSSHSNARLLFWLAQHTDPHRAAHRLQPPLARLVPHGSM
jgi:hypothetical protein